MRKAFIEDCAQQHWCLLQDLEATLEPLLYFYKQRRRAGESLGDFSARTGFDVLRQYTEGYVSPSAEQELEQIGVPKELYAALKQIADAQGKSLPHVASEAVRKLVSA